MVAPLVSPQKRTAVLSLGPLHRDPSSEDRDQPGQASPAHRGWFHVGGMPLSRDHSMLDGNLPIGNLPLNTLVLLELLWYLH